METPPTTSESRLKGGRAYWTRYLIGVFIALAASVAVTTLWRVQGWPYRTPVAMGVLFFFIPVVSPPPPGKPERSLAFRLGMGVVFGIVGALSLLVIP